MTTISDQRIREIYEEVQGCDGMEISRPELVAIIERLLIAESREKELEAQLALSAKNTTDAYREIFLLKHREKAALIALEDMHDATDASGEVLDWLEQAEKEMNNG